MLTNKQLTYISYIFFNLLVLEFSTRTQSLKILYIYFLFNSINKHVLRKQIGKKRNITI